MAPEVIDAAIAAASLALFGMSYGLARLATRPARVAAAPATPELGDEPPAVVSLLANRWRLTENAAESTLLDLAARRLVELRQPADDPYQTTVHLTGAPPPGDLAPYERRVLDRIRGLAVSGVVPVTALSFRNPKEAQGWNQRLHREVIADARRRGLSRRRFGRPLTLALVAVAAVSAAGVAVAGGRYGLRADEYESDLGLWLGVSAFLVLSGVAGRSPGERDTPAGRAVAARWLGVRAWLHGHEEFARLPPAAVTVWDHYLPYGAALGVTRTASAVLDLGLSGRELVWSSYGGGWRRVRVRYPRFSSRYGRTVPPLVFGALASGSVGAGLAYLSLRLAEGPAVPPAVLVAGLLAAGLLMLRGGYRLVRAATDLATTRTLTGEVLWLEAWQARERGVLLHHLAVDDGAGDRTTAWLLPSIWADRCRDGDVVTVRVRPWSRRVVGLAVAERGRAAQLAEAEPPGPPGRRRAGHLNLT